MAAKTDMERLGFFSELGYTTIKDPYTSSSVKPFNVSASKGTQMMTSSTKPKSAFQDGYFSKEFSRMMAGEAYSDMIALRRKQNKASSKKHLGGPYVPPSPIKKSSGLGGHYGTLGGPITSFSAATKPGLKYKSPGKNFLTNPGKKGTGYGYAAVTVGPLPKYESEPYDRARDIRKREQNAWKKKMKDGAFRLNMHPAAYFEGNPFGADRPLPPAKTTRKPKEKLKPFKPSNPGKATGGCKAGTFDPYPKHSDDPYFIFKFKREYNPKKFKGGVFKPSPGLKSTLTSSVMEQNVLKRMNTSNYTTLAATT